MPNLPNYREFFRSFTDHKIAAELSTGLIPTVLDIVPNDDYEIWISQEGYEIRLSEGQITKQNHGCTAQMQNYFGYLYEFQHNPLMPII